MGPTHSHGGSTLLGTLHSISQPWHCFVVRGGGGSWEMYGPPTNCWTCDILEQVLIASVGRQIGQCRLGESIPFSRPAGSASSIHRRKMGKWGKWDWKKWGNWTKIVPFFSDFSPISCQLHTFFIHFPKWILAIFQYYPFSSISPHFTPSPPQFSAFPLFFPHFPCFPKPLRSGGQFGCGSRGSLS